VLVVAPPVAAAPGAGGDPVPITASMSGTELHLDWDAVPDAEGYLVVDERTGEVLRRTSATEFRTVVAAPTSASLLVFADTGSSSRFLGKALAVAGGRESAVPAAVAVTTGAGTEVRWEPVAGVGTWMVRSGELALPTTTGTTTVLPPTDGPEEPVVEIAGLLPAAEGGPTALVTGFTLASPRFTAVDMGGDAAEGDVIAASVPVIQSTRFAYETYIPDPYINAPDTGSPFDCESGDGSDYWYSGDDRSFAYTSGKYRTRAVADYYWYAAVTGTSKDVSPTNRYRRTASGTFQYDSTRQASDAGLLINPVTNNGRDAMTQINHSVGQPYCSAMNNIDYDIREEAHANGSYYVLGRHDRMPNHQLVKIDYMSDGTPVHYKVFHHELTSPMCLNWMYPCAQWQYQYAR
jgi:hypothetical protein